MIRLSKKFFSLARVKNWRDSYLRSLKYCFQYFPVTYYFVSLLFQWSLFVFCASHSKRESGAKIIPFCFIIQIFWQLFSKIFPHRVFAVHFTGVATAKIRQETNSNQIFGWLFSYKLSTELLTMMLITCYRIVRILIINTKQVGVINNCQKLPLSIYIIYYCNLNRSLNRPLL